MTGPWTPLASALEAFHDRGEDVQVTVRNDFGQAEQLPVSMFFRGEDAFEEWEFVALRHCGRRVLDVGAGVGAHALVLQARDHEVTALEILPEAVRIMRERGVVDAREGTLFDLAPGQTFDTVILLMNGSMIAETLAGLDRLFDAAAGVLGSSGALILDSTDLQGAPNDESEREAEKPREVDGRYFGELHYQLSVGDQEGEVFPQLFVDPDTLKERAELGGWRTEVIWSGADGRYLARLSPR
jgi:SAM-dependent methyltransferase